MAKKQRNYDHEFKTQALKLAKEIGGAKAARELGIPANTLHGWMRAVRIGTNARPTIISISSFPKMRCVCSGITK